MDLQELLELNAQGLIPGPGEREEIFLERVASVRKACSSQESLISPSYWERPAEQLKSLFDFSPKWCIASFSSRGLAPWEAAATWIDVNRVYTIRIRRESWISWLIDPEEILAHEAAHAARAAFEEPQFEEVLAYMTSGSRWRKVLGPWFRKPFEGVLLLGLVTVGAIGSVAEEFLGGAHFSSLCYLSAALLCMTWSFRLARARRILERAAKTAANLLRDPQMVRAFIFRLMDEEIVRLAQNKQLLPLEELRWRLLKAAYLKREGYGADDLH